MKIIGLFGLLIGKLEDKVKSLVRLYGREKYLGTKTLGKSIKELEELLKRKRMNNNIKVNKDYRLKYFLTGENINIFIRRCKEINKLRNNLIHNFISLQKTNTKGIPDILQGIKKSIRLSAQPTEKHSEASKAILSGKKIKNEFILRNQNIFSPGGNIRSNLTIDDLVEICSSLAKALKPGSLV